MKIMTTLAERDYFLGLAALLNSMARHGTYVDKVIVGYREALPDWLPPLASSRHGQSFTTSGGVEVELVELNGSLHMVHEKPKWFLHVTEVLAPEATEYFFFDSDIVINTRMDFFGEWVQEGVAICGDVNFVFNRRHPIRQKWARIAREGGRTITNELDDYYNSGFLGWTQETKSFIQDWNDAFALLAPHSGNMNEFRVYDRTAVVLSTNQDSLNLAMMTTDQPLSLMGPEAMGFIYGLRLMHHPIGPKPWTRNFTREFFNGKPPRDSDLIFWENVNGSELQPVPDSKVRKMQRLCKTLRFGGRYYKSLG
ncbi:hypothetical protein [Neolewinella litorea]|uniref:Nucleotide-diphospho-sugar transferase domain-containing protein n=1 Tax=Neolewinella litorea TaxID=2562452 RepID=A0A4S4NHU9_9BACT|nr:hypothetical protein [Neolewinella litorea]THH39286.1 hypothetical protein E4021_11045 [Neolewinella litorea]